MFPYGALGSGGGNGSSSYFTRIIIAYPSKKACGTEMRGVQELCWHRFNNFVLGMSPVPLGELLAKAAAEAIFWHTGASGWI